MSLATEPWFSSIIVLSFVRMNTTLLISRMRKLRPRGETSQGKVTQKVCGCCQAQFYGPGAKLYLWVSVSSCMKLAGSVGWSPPVLKFWLCYVITWCHNLPSGRVSRSFMAIGTEKAEKQEETGWDLSQSPVPAHTLHSPFPIKSPECRNVFMPQGMGF